MTPDALQRSAVTTFMNTLHVIVPIPLIVSVLFFSCELFEFLTSSLRADTSIISSPFSPQRTAPYFVSNFCNNIFSGRTIIFPGSSGRHFG